MLQAATIYRILYPRIFSILKIVGTTHSVSNETFYGFTYFIGFFTTLFAGVFIVVYLLLFSIFFIYIILYYLISKIDWIKNKKNKEFDLIENKKFIFYIIKYLFIIIFMAFLDLILNNIISMELIYFGYYIFKSFHMTLCWLSSMLLFYSYIYFFVLKKIFRNKLEYKNLCITIYLSFFSLFHTTCNIVYNMSRRIFNLFKPRFNINIFISKYNIKYFK